MGGGMLFEDMGIPHFYQVPGSWHPNGSAYPFVFPMQQHYDSARMEAGPFWADLAAKRNPSAEISHRYAAAPSSDSETTSRKGFARSPPSSGRMRPAAGDAKKVPVLFRVNAVPVTLKEAVADEKQTSPVSASLEQGGVSGSNSEVPLSAEFVSAPSSDGSANASTRIETESATSAFVDVNVAAAKIQAAYRGHRVRQGEPINQLRIVEGVKSGLEALKRQYLEPTAGEKSHLDSKQRLQMSEALMGLLLRLDTVQNPLDSVRDIRKCTARKVIALMDSLDSMPQGRNVKLAAGQDDTALSSQEEDCNSGNVDLSVDGGEASLDAVESSLQQQNIDMVPSVRNTGTDDEGLPNAEQVAGKGLRSAVLTEHSDSSVGDDGENVPVGEVEQMEGNLNIGDGATNEQKFNLNGNVDFKPETVVVLSGGQENKEDAVIQGRAEEASSATRPASAELVVGKEGSCTSTTADVKLEETMHSSVDQYASGKDALLADSTNKPMNIPGVTASVRSKEVQEQLLEELRNQNEVLKARLEREGEAREKQAHVALQQAAMLDALLQKVELMEKLLYPKNEKIAEPFAAVGPPYGFMPAAPSLWPPQQHLVKASPAMVSVHPGSSSALNGFPKEADSINVMPRASPGQEWLWNTKAPQRLSFEPFVDGVGLPYHGLEKKGDDVEKTVPTVWAVDPKVGLWYRIPIANIESPSKSLKGEPEVDNRFTNGLQSLEMPMPSIVVKGFGPHKGVPCAVPEKNPQTYSSAADIQLPKTASIPKSIAREAECLGAQNVMTGRNDRIGKGDLSVVPPWVFSLSPRQVDPPSRHGWPVIVGGKEAGNWPLPVVAEGGSGERIEQPLWYMVS